MDLCRKGTNKRPDVIVFVNGLPLVLFELKTPARADADNEDAYQQIQNYMRQIPSFFIYNAFCAISDMLHTVWDHHCQREALRGVEKRRRKLRVNAIRRLENAS